MNDSDPRSAETLARLTSVSRALTYATSLEEVLDITVDCVGELLEAPRAVLMLADDDHLLRIRASRGIPDEEVERFREPLDETLVTRLSGLTGGGSEEGFLGVPLIVRGRVTGLLAVLGREGGAPTAREEWLLSALADQAAVALDNARSESSRSTLESRVSELREESVRREEALRMVGHDLRSPLSALLGYIHLLRTESYGPTTEAQRQAFDRLSAIGSHLQAVASNVLEFGRLAAGTVRAECKPLDIDQVVEDAVVVVGLAAEEAGIELVTDLAEAPRVVADPDRLRQVLVQLLDNALKYAPENSRVTVSARAEADPDGGEDRVAIRVADEGPGIPAEHVQSIFEPYRQLPDRTRAGGLGLGLALARGLMERMGGTLDVEDPGTPGATLVIRLPAASAPS